MTIFDMESLRKTLLRLFDLEEPPSEMDREEIAVQLARIQMRMKQQAG